MRGSPSRVPIVGELFQEGGFQIRGLAEISKVAKVEDSPHRELWSLNDTGRWFSGVLGERSAREESRRIERRGKGCVEAHHGHENKKE